MSTLDLLGMEQEAAYRADALIEAKRLIEEYGYQEVEQIDSFLTGLIEGHAKEAVNFKNLRIALKAKA